MSSIAARAVVLLVLGLVACGPHEPADDGASATAERPFQVALLTPGPISDAGWNASAYEGLRRIEAELDARIAQVETKTPPEFEDGFREYAEAGFDLCFGHGFEFQDAAAAVGAEYPETIFITSSGTTVRDNVAPMVFRLEQATYMLGALAALMAEDGDKAAVIGGMEIPSVASTFLAFEGGVHAVDPDMEVVTAYIGNWDDVSAAKEAALAQIRQGARFLFHNATCSRSAPTRTKRRWRRARSWRQRCSTFRARSATSLRR